MGVDIPDIQQNIHWWLPSTLEAYVQENCKYGLDGRHKLI
jgi:superfamily II DNA helicase RecQ